MNADATGTIVILAGTFLAKKYTIRTIAAKDHIEEEIKRKFPMPWIVASCEYVNANPATPKTEKSAVSARIQNYHLQ